MKDSLLHRLLIVVGMLFLSAFSLVLSAFHPGPRSRIPDPAFRNPGRYEFTQVHMGLPVRIVLHAVDEGAAREAAAAAFARIAELDRMMSDYRADSELRSLERHSREWVPVSAELFSVLGRAVAIARASGGGFDPSVGPLVALWREARKTGRMPRRAVLDAARTHVGWRLIQLDRARRAVRLLRPGMRLDLGGIAKGYILQDALATLGARGIRSALLEAGGDIVAGDAPPGRDGWSIETPLAEDPVKRHAARLTNAALSTSGGTVQFVEINGVRYSHVIDPRTGLGLTNHFVASVIAADAATADALATALTVVGPNGAHQLLAQFPGVVTSIVSASPR